MNQKDVIVVGGGPAGLWAAYSLAKKGRSVLVAEMKKDYDSLYRACSMQFIIDSDYEGEGVQVKEGELYFPKSDFSVPYHGKLVPLYNKYYHSPKNHVMRFANADGKEPFSYKFDKCAMLKELYELALSAGVEFRLNTMVQNVKETPDGVEVAVKGSDGEETLKAVKLIDAEGVNAAVCGKIGFPGKRPHLATALCVKYVVKGIKGVEPGSWNLYYGRAYHSNAAVIIGPSLYGDDVMEVTITGSKSAYPKDIYREFTTDSPMAENFKDAELIRKMSCSVNAYMPLLEPCTGNCIVVGDAAAFIEVEVQGALLCGQHAAEAVDRELSGEDGWTAYTEWWKSSFEFNGADYMKVSQGYALVPVYTDDELDYLFALAEGKCMPGTYSQYKTPKYMWDSILTHTEQIKAERPEIYAKIQHLAEHSIEASFQ